MKLSPNSQEIIDRLMIERELKSQSVYIGPLSDHEARLLQVITSNYQRLISEKGVQQALLLRELNNRAIQEQESDASMDKLKSNEAPAVSLPSFSISSPSQWRLISLQCVSIRGIAPPGELFEFKFDGTSNLIYGPNGSGKSSLLGAVVWVLTGTIVTDAADPAIESPLYSIPKDSEEAGADLGKGTRIKEWPVICTLPESSADNPECWARIELHCNNTDCTIYIKRSLQSGLELSIDDIIWFSCPNLSVVGITPIDLQLSLLAPTTFGRQTLESAPDTKTLLSLLLGYDDIEHISDFISKVSGSCTTLYKSEKVSVDEKWNEINKTLINLADYQVDNTIYGAIAKLSSIERPSIENIVEVGKKLNETIINMENHLAMSIGVTQNNENKSNDISESLIIALNKLENGINAVLPSISLISLDNVLPSKQGYSPEVLLSKIEQQYLTLKNQIQQLIANRIHWWQKENMPGSKVNLFLTAVQYLHEDNLCPLCGQDLREFPEIIHELCLLKDIDPGLLKDIRSFFLDIEDKLRNQIPASIINLGLKSISARLMDDWLALRNFVLRSFNTIANRYDSSVDAVVTSISIDDQYRQDVFPDDLDQIFYPYSSSIQQILRTIENGIYQLKWSNKNLQSVIDQLNNVLFSKTNTESLYNTLFIGKDAALAIRPLRMCKKDLTQVYGIRQQIVKDEIQLQQLELIKDSIEHLKPIGKYIRDEITSVFLTIKNKTLENWELLYPEKPTGMKPARLTLGKAKDKTVEALLSCGSYEALSQHYANAGLQRAIALCFYFALVERHPRGLEFILMDDPILSLDDDHRNIWVDEILRPYLCQLQIILATHQGQFKYDCDCHFIQHSVTELNPRDYRRRITWHSGKLLDRAINAFSNDWRTVPNILRQYVEEYLVTLDAYNPYNTIINDPLQMSINSAITSYSTLQPPNPLAGKAQIAIVGKLTDINVSRVINPGSHYITSAQLTSSVVNECLSRLVKWKGSFNQEIKRLNDERRRRLRGLQITSSLIDFPRIEANWSDPLGLLLIGQVAAKAEHSVVELAIQPKEIKISSGCAVLVSSDTLDPVARPGQWVLLEEIGNDPQDGDLVALTDSNGNRYLRRIWSDKDKWLLQSINPVNPIKSISCPKKNSAIKKVIGVLYHSSTPTMNNHQMISEWEMSNSFNINTFNKLHTFIVEGDSLNPIALKGQYLLVGLKCNPGDHVTEGNLFVIETNDSTIGNVVKRVFTKGKDWILVSTNPIAAISPDILPLESLVSFWPVYGVLFEVEDTETV